MTGTFTTRLRATLTAAGLIVALGAQTVRAAEQPPSPLPTTPPVQAYPPTGTPTPLPAALPAPVPGQSPGMLVPGPVAPEVVIGTPQAVPGAPCGGGEQVYSGGPGYLMSSCWGEGCTSSMAYIRADYMYLRRDVDQPFSVISGQLNDGSIFSVRVEREEFDYDPALRATFGVALIETSACDLFLESTYFGLHHANVSGFALGGAGVSLFGSPLGPLFDSTNALTYSYVSDLHSFESNLKWDWYVDNTLYLLLGMRYIRFDDRFKVREAGTLAVAPAFEPQAFRTTRVTNNLIGVQIGADYQTRDLTSRWNAVAYGRAGVYANILDGEFRQGANASNRGVFIDEVDPGRTQVSVALEGGFTGTYKVTPNLLVRGGYHVMWLGAIALAPDQPVPDLFTGDFNGKNSTNQDAFFYGPFIGLEYHWGCCR